MLMANWICWLELNALVNNFIIRFCFQTWAGAKAVPSSYCTDKHKSQRRSVLPGELTGLATSLSAGGSWQLLGFSLQREPNAPPRGQAAPSCTDALRVNSGKGVSPPGKFRLTPGREEKHRKRRCFQLKKLPHKPLK